MSSPKNASDAPALRIRRIAMAAGAALALGLAVAAAALLAGRFQSLNSTLGSETASENLQAIGDAGALSSSNEPASAYDKAPSAASPYAEGPFAFEAGNTEEYSLLDEPGFVSVEANPLSTLSADVDTASYCNLRRMVREGAWPAEIPAGAVRTEELLNYFDYDYPAPVGSDLFGVSAKIGDCPWNEQTKLLVMGFATGTDDAAASDGANLVFLVDVSGSMDEPEKLPLLKESFATLVEQLDERDRVSIVTYANEERVVLEGASGADKRRIMRAVDGLAAGGSTNGEAGLETAYRLAEKFFIEGGANRIVMASDGDLNVGMSSESDLHDYVERKRDIGVYLSVLGFGSGNYKDNKMETLADHGNGAYHYIDCTAEAERVLGKNLQANLVPLADDVKVQVEFNPQQVKGYRLIGYENRALSSEDFLDNGADAGEVGPGHAFTLAYEVVPASSSLEIATPELKYGSAASAENAQRDDGYGHIAVCTDDSEWLTCSMRYRPAGQSNDVNQTHVVDASADIGEPDADWRFAAAVIECSMLLRHSNYAGTASYASALELVDAPGNPQREEFAALLETLEQRSGGYAPHNYTPSRDR